MPTKRLVRPQDRALFGVCAGLAAYFGIDPTVIRILWVLLTIASAGTGIPLYFVLVLIMPNGNPDDGITAAAPTTTTAPAPPAGATLGGEIVEKIESAIDRATSDSGGSGGGGNVA
jgi:phage shock protein PspC (stress-responsive transcriptional regulator)